MARDFIKINQLAPQATLLRSYISAQRQAYNLGKQCQSIMTHLNDGTVWTDVETAFGIDAGKGQTVFDLVNGAVGSMEGAFTVSDAKTITEKVG